MHAYIYTHIYVDVSFHIYLLCAYICGCVYMYIFIHMCMYVCICIYVYIYT